MTNKDSFTTEFFNMALGIVRAGLISLIIVLALYALAMVITLGISGGIMHTFQLRAERITEFFLMDFVSIFSSIFIITVAFFGLFYLLDGVKCMNSHGAMLKSLEEKVARG